MFFRDEVVLVIKVLDLNTSSKEDARKRMVESLAVIYFGIIMHY